MDALTMGELVAVLALGQDNSFGQPLESQMRSTLLAIWLAEAAGMPAQVRDTVYWTAQLRYLGCTAHAHERIPLPMRIVHLAQDAETLARLRSPEEAITVSPSRCCGGRVPLTR